MNRRGADEGCPSPGPSNPAAPTGKLLFEDEAPLGQTPPAAVPASFGQVGQTSKRRYIAQFMQEGELPRPSERLRHDTPSPNVAEASIADRARPKPGTATVVPDDGGRLPGAAPQAGAVAKPDIKAARDGRRLDKSKHRAERAEGKLGKAHDNLAKRKSPKKPGIIKKTGRSVKSEAWMAIHSKVYRAEDENVGVKAAHRTELAGEGVVRGVTRFIKRRIRTRPARQVRKWESREMKARADYQYRKMARDNPQLTSNPISRHMQKRRLQKQYRKQAREAAKTGGTLARRTAEAVGNAGRTAAAFAVRHPMVPLALGGIFLLIVTLQSCVGGAMTIGQGVLGAFGGTSYLTEDADITGAATLYTEWETDMLLEARNAESNRPGYDQYIYNIDAVGHDHIALISFLTAKHNDFTLSDVQSVLRDIFDAQYDLTFTERVEVRYRTETRTDPDTGEDYDVQVPYNYYILEVTLTARPFADVLAALLTPGDEQDRYDIYNITKGNRQYVGSPFPYNWLPYLSCPFGWRVHPITGEKDYHRGIDIALPAGTEILAGGEGVVVEAVTHELYGQTVRIDYGDGITARYSHCSAVLVSAGQTVEAGAVIARVGSTGESTGPHLDLEVLKGGELLNPLNFIEIPF